MAAEIAETHYGCLPDPIMVRSCAAPYFSRLTISAARGPDDSPAPGCTQPVGPNGLYAPGAAPPWGVDGTCCSGAGKPC